MMHTKPVLFAVLFALLFSTIFCLRLWRAERQAELHTAHLLKAAGKRDWTKVAAFLDDSYADQWGHDKSSALDDARQALAQFFSLTITGRELAADANLKRASVSTRLRFDGSGTAIAQEVARRVNSLQSPFTFEWRRKSWKPWDWKLVRVDNAELQIDRNFGF
jgi:hypothetical protein